MPIVAWNPDLSVGVAALDDDHQRLIDAMNDVFDALLGGDCSVVACNALLTLSNYIDQHFSREEDWMEQNGYADLPQHRREHDALRDQVRRLLLQQDTNADDLSAEMLMVLKDWLIGHIAVSDQASASRASNGPSHPW